MDALAPLLGRTLIIVAHPDDEAVTCAALMQRMREPCVLFCTDGAPLDPYFWSRHGSREAYSLLRQKEARLALSLVGVTKLEFLKARSVEHIIDQQLSSGCRKRSRLRSRSSSGYARKHCLRWLTKGGIPTTIAAISSPRSSPGSAPWPPGRCPFTSCSTKRTANFRHSCRHRNPPSRCTRRPRKSHASAWRWRRTPRKGISWFVSTPSMKAS